MAGLFVISLLLAQAGSGAAPDVAEFPSSAASLESGTIVTVDTPALERLTDTQLRALMQFAGSCGRVILLNVNSSIEALFRDDAACDGQYLLAIESLDDLHDATATLEQLDDPVRASEADINRLLTAIADDKFNLRNLIWFWTGYVLLALVLISGRRTRVSALGFGVIASLLVPVLWPAQSIRTSVAWAEAEADDRVIAFSLIEQISTKENGKYLSDRTRKIGSFDLNPSLGFSIGDAELEICNQGKGTTETTHIRWKGDVFTVPTLGPGASWNSTHGSILEQDALDTPELSLFVRRSKGLPLTLLRRLPVSDKNDHAWLMQYIPPDQASPSCDLQE